MYETMYPQREIILYQLSLSLLIELPIALVAIVLIVLSDWSLYWVVIVVFLVVLMTDLILAKRYYETAQVNVYENVVEIIQGKLISKIVYIPKNKIYMVYKKNNVVMDFLKIDTIELRTLATNYEIRGLSKTDSQIIIDVLKGND